MASNARARSTPRQLLAANWKMNGLRRDGLDRARDLAARARAADPSPCDIVICPPVTLLVELRDALDGSPIALGAQDCHAETNGAHTGDIAAPMLVDAGCRYVIVGHSERRAEHGESDAVVRAKAAAAAAHGLVPIICVGESEAARELGRALDVVSTQLRGSVPEGASAAEVIIAYEPIWAIGTGKTPTDEDIAGMHRHLREAWAERFSGSAQGLRVVYGGSVKAGNASDILNIEGVDGALVGGASLVADDFWTICRGAG